jgi:NAD(P)-dependent dehydrogenase (short-subunit alcohol dehydrogenase family)
MLDGKIAIVTGAGQGLGRGIACEMVRQRAAGIAVVDRNRQAAEETVALAKEQGGEVLVIECDLRDRDQIEGMVDSAAAHFGGLDVLVNNAGIVETPMTADCAVDTLPEDVWDAVYQVNLRAPWLATKFAAPHLRRSDRGPSIVNACSVGGLVAFPRAPAYCATKGGIAQLTKATAVDLGPAVRCNAYAPGAIDTPMAHEHVEHATDPAAAEWELTAPQVNGRLGTPEEVGKLACFLASDDAAFLTGAVVPIDGGFLAWGSSRARPDADAGPQGGGR